VGCSSDRCSDSLPADGERVELAREGAVRVGPARLGARAETGGGEREVHPVGSRRTAESQCDALERPVPVAQLAQTRVDFDSRPDAPGSKFTSASTLSS